jgi:2-polyprenyl-3-methyl-5-hydroxy-6-metoxy-1,4-benzoquinol methylase
VFPGVLGASNSIIGNRSSSPYNGMHMAYAARSTEASSYDTRACPVCRNVDREVMFTKPFGNVQRCTTCSLVSLRDRATGDLVKCSYNRSYFLCGEKRGGACGYDDYFGVEWSSRESVASGLALYVASLVERSTGALLDVGCGGGLFVYHALRAGWHASGIDASKFACSMARRRLRVPVWPGTIESFSSSAVFSSQFDVITMLDVIEHLPMLIRDLGVVRKWLRPGGRLVITTPRFGGRLFAREGGAYSQFKRDHVWYFTFDTLSRVLYSVGFTDVREAGSPPLGPGLNAAHTKYSEDRDHLFVVAAA